MSFVGLRQLGTQPSRVHLVAVLLVVRALKLERCVGVGDDGRDEL